MNKADLVKLFNDLALNAADFCKTDDDFAKVDSVKAMIKDAYNA